MDIGCDHYRIINHKNKPTSFEFVDNIIKVIADEKVFGIQYGGSIQINIEKCKIDIKKDSITFYVNKEETIFVQFFNFTNRN